MGFVVIYDANVLHPPVLRDVLIRIAQDGLVQARWTNDILDETFRSIEERRPDIDPARLKRTRELMGGAIRDVLVTGHEALIPAVTLPDPDDRHVVAAAVRARAQVIVTRNVRDFPADELRKWDVEARTPDEFLLDQFHLSGPILYGAIQRVADSWRNPPGTVGDVIDRLERSGLVETAAHLRGWQTAGWQPS
jgi:predicted nucleic acid-binding protein